MECMKPQSWQRRRLNGLTNGLVGRGIDVGAGRQPAPWWDLLSFQPIRVDTAAAHHRGAVANVQERDWLLALRYGSDP